MRENRDDGTLPRRSGQTHRCPSLAALVWRGCGFGHPHNPPRDDTESLRLEGSRFLTKRKSCQDTERGKHSNQLARRAQQTLQRTSAWLN